jgi:ubiquinone biosynthesis protein UbiJ
MLEQENITNEDDVMMLSLASDRERLFAEIDTLPDDTEEVQKKLMKLFTKKQYESILYLASRNELE